MQKLLPRHVEIIELIDEEVLPISAYTNPIENSTVLTLEF